MRRIALCLTVAAFVFMGCTSQNAAATDPSAQPAPTLTYYQDAAPIFASRCASCHSPGNIAPFALLTYSDAMTYAPLIKPALVNHLMPPMPPDTSDASGCPQIDDARVMPDSERNALIAWVDGGALAGDAAHPAPTPPAADALGPPTATYDSGVDYASSFQGADEYRCFVIDPALTATFNLIAIGVHSTNPAIVHHTIVYAQLPQNKADVDALDAADPRPATNASAAPAGRARSKWAPPPSARCPGVPQRLGRAAAGRHPLRRAGALQLRQRPRLEPHRRASVVGAGADAGAARPVDGELHVRHSRRRRRRVGYRDRATSR